MLRLALVATLSFGVGCSSDPEAVESGCTLRNGACVASSSGVICCPQQGLEYDEGRACLSGTKEQIIACPHIPVSGGACVASGIVGCSVTFEGGARRVWRTSSTAATWQRTAEQKCSSTLETGVSSATRCAM